MTDLRFPRDYGGYRLTGLLGAGGTAEVYRAVDAKGRHVAIRRVAAGLASDPEGQEILREEARIWVGLRHPNIVEVFDVGSHQGEWFLVLELVEGASLDEVLRAMGPMPIREALCVAHRMSLALAAAQSLTLGDRQIEVVHRDVKPANILLSTEGRVKLTDFGIARANDRLGRTAANVVKGSLHFLAPEQVRKDLLDSRTDLFALGCTLHTMLTCKPLFDREKDDVLRALARGQVPAPPRWMPEPLRALLAWMTAADPAARPASGTIAAEQIAALLFPETPSDVEKSIGERVVRYRESFPDTIELPDPSITEESPSRKPS